jgi:hypothetical protein
MSNPMLRLFNLFSFFVFLFFLALSLRAQSPEKKSLKNISKNNSRLSAFSYPEQDCRGAIVLQTPFLGNQKISGGAGSLREVDSGATCLVGGETNSIWYRFRIYRSGTLGFLLETQANYDFLLYNLSGSSCEELAQLTPLRCNFSAQAGNTGLDPSAINEGALSYNAQDSPIMPGLNVREGEEYFLMVNSLMDLETSFALRFTGSCSIVPDDSLQAPRIIAPSCFPADSLAQLAVEFNAPLRCLPDLSLINFRVRNSENEICPILSGFCLNQADKGILRFAVRLIPSQGGEYFFSYLPQSLEDSLYDQSGSPILPFTRSFRVNSPLPAPQLEWDAAASFCKNQRIKVRNLSGLPANTEAVWEATAPVLITDGPEPHSKYFTFQEGGVKTVSLRLASGTCFSEKVSIEKTIYPLPYTVSAPPRCGPGPVTLSFIGNFAQGQAFEIYLSPGQAPIGVVNQPPYAYTYVTPDLATPMVLYVKGVWPASCSLSQEFVTVPIAIFPLPEPPHNIMSSPLGCGTNTAKIDAELVPGSGHDMFLYETEESSSPLAVNKRNFLHYFHFIISNLNAPVTYYLETKDTITGCRSARRQPVELRTMPIPDPPVAPPSVSICGRGKARIKAEMGNVPGTGIRLYTTCGVQYGVPYLGDNAIAFADEPPFVLQTPEVTTHTTFYLHAWNPAEGMICIGGSCPPCFSGCTPVVVRVEEMPQLPSGPEKLERCGGGKFIIEPQMPFSGMGVRLFDRPFGGQPLAEATELPFSLATPILTRSATFYLETFGLNSGCVSASRFPVIASVHPIPLAPQAQDVVRCGPGALTLTIRNRDASPQQLQLYSSPQAQEPFATSLQTPWEYRTDILSTSVTFYLRAQSAKGCLSEWVAVALIINPMPGAPEITVNNFDNRPLIFWNKVGGAEFYDLRYKKKEELQWRLEIMVTDTFYRFNDLEEGEYQVEVRSVCGDSASEWSAQRSFLIKVTALPNLLPLGSRVLLYPNPTQGRVTLQFFEFEKGGTINLALFDSEGKKRWAQNELVSVLGQNSLILDFAPLPPGLYILAITSGNQTHYLKITLYN